jgi:hypothetical protein
VISSFVHLLFRKQTMFWQNIFVAFFCNLSLEPLANIAHLCSVSEHFSTDVLLGIYKKIAY